MRIGMAIAVCMITSAVCIAPPVQAQEGQFSMDYWGFTLLEQQVLFGLGFVPLIEPPLVVDLENYQYTWVMEDVVLDTFYVEDGVEYYEFTGGTFKVYEDTVRPWNAVYSDENCQDPDWVGYISERWTFEDGELFLLGEFRYISATYYVDWGFGDYEGIMDLTGGSHLEDIPPLLRYGWTFGGTTDQPWACIPPAYQHRWDGQLFLIQDPTMTQRRTWSGIKSVFR